MFALFFGWKRFSCVSEPQLHQLQPPLPDAIWHFKLWLFPGRALLGHWKEKEKRKRSFSFQVEADLQINPERHGLFLTFSKFQLFCWPASLQGAALNQLSLIRPLTPDTPPPGRPSHRLLDLLNHLQAQDWGEEARRSASGSRWWWGVGVGWCLPAELQHWSEITEPRCTARSRSSGPLPAFLHCPSKGDAHTQAGRK